MLIKFFIKNYLGVGKFDPNIRTITLSAASNLLYNLTYFIMFLFTGNFCQEPSTQETTNKIVFPVQRVVNIQQKLNKIVFPVQIVVKIQRKSTKTEKDCLSPFKVKKNQRNSTKQIKKIVFFCSLVQNERHSQQIIGPRRPLYHSWLAVKPVWNRFPLNSCRDSLSWFRLLRQDGSRRQSDEPAFAQTFGLLPLLRQRPLPALPTSSHGLADPPPLQ